MRAGCYFLIFSLVVGCGDDVKGTAPGPNGGGPEPGQAGQPQPGGALAGTCSIFPADNPWNRDISEDPLDPNSDVYMKEMNASGGAMMHPDFGSDPTYGIPFILVPGSQAKVPVSFMYASESDPGPYPIPLNAPIEGATDPTGDRHVLVIDKDACKLFELFDAHPQSASWQAGSGALFDLKSNVLRPDQWTSADAAGLPIFPGLVRYEEAVTLGEIKHALRFTMHTTQNAFVHPATHAASSNTSANVPPMGLRVRLKASFDVSAFKGASKAVVAALKRYGMFLADNGSNWYLSGEASSGSTKWNDEDLAQLKKVPASAFEVVKLGPIVPQNR